MVQPPFGDNDDGDGDGDDDLGGSDEVMDTCHESEDSCLDSTPTIEECWIACIAESQGIICIVALNIQSQLLRNLSFAQSVCYDMLFSAIDQLKVT
jgi:hypothetical protein